MRVGGVRLRGPAERLRERYLEDSDGGESSRVESTNQHDSTLFFSCIVLHANAELRR